ncbi:hypothetical protein BDW59DRAFT_161082 [Aspergillus cavernicola]|uniref:ABM domain-containing protein n=1 Tax=Aspergillus cavernicola TaxID=176166 RepID=A0ABR4IEP2_9EURO
MPSYLLLFLEPREDQKANFPEWRREVFSTDSSITRCLYLDATDAVTETNTYRYLNIYRFVGSAPCTEPKIEDQLSSHSTNIHLTSYHWQIYHPITESREPSLFAPTVVTVGMTIPTDPTSHNELSRWYAEEHIPALATVPGWQAAFRLQLVSSSDGGGDSTAPYLAIHEWGEPNELGKQIWKKAILTPGTKGIEDLQTAPMQRRVWKLSL